MTQFIACPECGPVVSKPVHAMCPDLALFDMLWHFLHAHPSMSPLDMLDDIETSDRQLSTNGAV